MYSIVWNAMAWHGMAGIEWRHDVPCCAILCCAVPDIHNMAKQSIPQHGTQRNTVHNSTADSAIHVCNTYLAKQGVAQRTAVYTAQQDIA